MALKLIYIASVVLFCSRFLGAAAWGVGGMLLGRGEGGGGYDEGNLLKIRPTSVFVS